MLAGLIISQKKDSSFTKFQPSWCWTEYKNSQIRNSGCEREALLGFVIFPPWILWQDMRGRIHAYSSLCLILTTVVHLWASHSSSAKGSSLSISKDKNMIYSAQGGTRNGLCSMRLSRIKLVWPLWVTIMAITYKPFLKTIYSEEPIPHKEFVLIKCVSSHIYLHRNISITHCYRNV